MMLGFTNNRALLITGNAFFNNDMRIRNVYEAYLAIKADSKLGKRQKGIIDTMWKSIIHDNPNLENQVYKSSDDATTKFFKVFTYLANNHLDNLSARLYVPYSKRLQVKEGKDIRVEISDHASDYKGYIFREKSGEHNPLLIVGTVNNEGNIDVIDMKTNTKKQVPWRKISKYVYQPYSQIVGNKVYVLFGRSWYEVKSKTNTVNGKQQTVFTNAIELESITDNGKRLVNRLFENILNIKSDGNL
jgi:hypothetical protein